MAYVAAHADDRLEPRPGLPGAFRGTVLQPGDRLNEGVLAELRGLANVSSYRVAQLPSQLPAGRLVEHPGGDTEHRLGGAA